MKRYGAVALLILAICLRPTWGGPDNWQWWVGACGMGACAGWFCNVMRSWCKEGAK